MQASTTVQEKPKESAQPRASPSQIPTVRRRNRLKSKANDMQVLSETVLQTEFHTDGAKQGAAPTASSESPRKPGNPESYQPQGRQQLRRALRRADSQRTRAHPGRDRVRPAAKRPPTQGDLPSGRRSWSDGAAAGAGAGGAAEPVGEASPKGQSLTQEGPAGREGRGSQWPEALPPHATQQAAELPHQAAATQSSTPGKPTGQAGARPPRERGTRSDVPSGDHSGEAGPPPTGGVAV